MAGDSEMRWGASKSELPLSSPGLNGSCSRDEIGLGAVTERAAQVVDGVRVSVAGIELHASMAHVVEHHVAIMAL